MVKGKELCISCNKNVLNTVSVRFECPQCGKSEMIRCNHCRKIGAKYKCSSCGFIGPN